MSYGLGVPRPVTFFVGVRAGLLNLGCLARRFNAGIIGLKTNPYRGLNPDTGDGRGVDDPGTEVPG